MFDNTNPYTLKEIDDGEKKIYIAVFKNGNGETVEEEIAPKVAVTLFRTFVRKERNMKRSDERHITRFEIKDYEEFNKYNIEDIESSEDTFINKLEKESLYNAINKLPKTQRRRLILYYFEGYTLEEIAVIEGCSVHSVFVGIERAKENLISDF